MPSEDKEVLYRLVDLGAFIYRQCVDGPPEDRILNAGTAALAVMKAVMVAPEWAQAFVTEYERVVQGDDVPEAIRLEAIARALLEEIPMEAVQ